MAKAKLIICPYCGATQPVGDQCRECSGRFDGLSRRASHNEMGPWAIRNPDKPFSPGCSYETVVRLIEAGRIDGRTIVRGPTTRQFWTIVQRVPGLAHLVGRCHACGADVDPVAHDCPECDEPFGAYLDRNYLGLPEVEPLPGEAPSDDPGGSGGGWTPPPFARRGHAISSFVPDAELLAPEPVLETPPIEAPTPTSTESPDRATIRALRKRSRDLERRVRLLGLALVALVVVVVVWAML